MPLPTPKSDEEHDEFMDRCMADPIMNEEYDDNDQRLAVCQTQWDEAQESDESKAAPGPKPAPVRAVERRILSGDDMELRVVDSKDGKPPHIHGYAARFNRESVDLGGFVEQIRPGAFTKAAEKSDVRALKNHNADLVLGRTTAKTLKLAENSRGLKFDIAAPDTTTGRDTVEEIRRGDITGCSFSFMLADGGDEWTEKNGVVMRTILEVDELFDVGPVTFPAYPDTSVAVRSLERFQETRQAPLSPEAPPAEPATPTVSLDDARKRVAEAKHREQDAHCREALRDHAAQAKA